MIVVDNTFGGEALEEAEKLRDPSHVRCYTSRGVAAAVRGAPGSASTTSSRCRMRVELEPWLARAGCAGEEAARVRELVADRIEDGWVTLDRIALKGVK